MSDPDASFDLVHTYRGVPFNRSLPQSLLSALPERAELNGDAPFVTAVGADERTETLTYAKLDVDSAAWAGWLTEELGVTKGDVLAMLPRNDVLSVTAIFGALRTGCGVLLLNSNDPAARLRAQAEAVAARTVVRAPSAGVEGLHDAVVLDERRVLGRAWACRRIDVRAGDDALLFGTSGSTAASKLVVQSHGNAAANAEAVGRHHRLRPQDRLLACLPIHHVNCLHLTIFGTFAAGAHVILAHGFDALRYRRLVDRFRPRIASVVPSILEALAGTSRGASWPSDFDYFVSAAAPLSAQTARRVSKRLGVRVVQGYGLTETTNFSTTMPVDLPDESYRRLMHASEIPPIGVGLDGNEVDVLSADGNPVEPGRVGEICMRGHNVMMRYAGNEEATRDAFRGGWFHSQDLGFYVDDLETGHRFFVITGRAKNMAKVAGESVSLDEMERVLSTFSGVVDAACAALPHRLLGEEVIAAVVCPEHVRDADLRAHLRRTFAAAVLPRLVVRLDSIPRTSTGKIRRPELARILAAHAEGLEGRGAERERRDSE